MCQLNRAEKIRFEHRGVKSGDTHVADGNEMNRPALLF